MKKVFQQQCDGINGDCMQAAVASLFSKELTEVPKFVEFGEEWFHVLLEYVENENHEFIGSLHNEIGAPAEYSLDRLKDFKGINGYFFAAVRSPVYWEKNKGTHAVVIDCNCNIIHDPNPAYQGLEAYPDSMELGYNGVICAYLIEPQEQIN